MKTANEKIQDNILSRVIYVNRYNTQVQNEVVKELLSFDNQFVGRLGTLLEGFSKKDIAALAAGKTRDNENFKKLNRLLIQMKNKSKEIAQSTVKQMNFPFIEYEAKFAKGNLEAGIPAQVKESIPVEAVNKSKLNGLFAATQFNNGDNLATATRGWSDAKVRMVKQVIQQGFFNGLTRNQIEQELRGTRANNYLDGRLSKGNTGTRKSVRNLVGMATAAYSNAARETVYSANDNYIKGLEHVATLDSRTSDECRNLDGTVYKLDDTSRPAIGTIHYGICRSVYVPIVKSWKELGFDIEELPVGTRSSLNGAVPANLDYYDWLLDVANDNVLIDAVGVKRAALFKSGDLGKKDFKASLKGGLTLDEIEKRYKLDL